MPGGGVSLYGATWVWEATPALLFVGTVGGTLDLTELVGVVVGVVDEHILYKRSAATYDAIYAAGVTGDALATMVPLVAAVL